MAMNKKAIIGREFLYFLAVVFIVLLLILTFILSTLLRPGASGTSYEPELQKISDQNIVSLTAFLNTKTAVDGQNITMADLARLARMDSNYTTIFKEKSKTILSPVFGSNVILSIYSKGFYLDILEPGPVIQNQIYMHLPFPQDLNFGIRFGVKND
jgi:hypothetical protein